MLIYEPCHEKAEFCLCENEAISAVLISAFIFAARLVQMIILLNLYLWPAPVTVGPGWICQRLVNLVLKLFLRGLPRKPTQHDFTRPSVM